MAETQLVIRAERLDLIPMSPALMRAIRAADWDRPAQRLGVVIPDEWRSDDWGWLGQRPEQAEADPSVMPWLPRVMLLRAGSGRRQPVVVGDAGFHGPPDPDGRVEVGYRVVSEHRRHGYAEEAVRALMAWAAAEYQVTRFRACISPENTPSLNLIRKLGFVQIGTQHQERRAESLIFHSNNEMERPADSP